jgi:Domain of unknown function (DUF4129)
VTCVPAPTSRTWTGATVPGPAAPVATALDVPARPRTVHLPRWVAASVVGAGLAVLVLATTADGTALLQAPSESALGSPPGPLATPGASASVAATSSVTPPTIIPIDLPWLRPLVLTTLVVAALIMVAGTAVALVHVARRLWEDRWQAPDVLHALESQPLDVDLAAPRDALAEAAQRMRDVLHTGSPRNAVVQCWLLLVDSLERHGVTPDPAESPTELTRHALNQISTDRAAVAELTSLFLEARFSEHVIGEDARLRAAAALGRVTAALELQPAGRTAGAGGDTPAASPGPAT